MNGNLILPDNYVNNNPNIINYVSKNINNDFHYLFEGQVGSGKTYLAEIIGNHFKFRIINANRIYREYLRLSNSNFSDKNEQLTKCINCLRGDNIIFDDIGAEKPKTEASNSFIEGLIEDRYDWWRKGIAKRTIFTTNLNAGELAEKYGDRVVDRLQEMMIIMKFKAKSFRSDKKNVIVG